MKKIHVLGLALFAVLAVSAVSASMASAAIWEIGAKEVTENLPVATTGELTLTAKEEPIIGTVKVLCSGVLDGTVGLAGVDNVTEVLSLTGELISSTALSGTALTCTNVEKCTSPLVWPDGLPWPSKLLSATEDESKATEIGFYVQCMGIIGEPSDLCVQATVLGLKLKNVATGVEVETNEIEKANCTTAGANKGSIVSDAPALITSPEGIVSVK